MQNDSYCLFVCRQLEAYPTSLLCPYVQLYSWYIGRYNESMFALRLQQTARLHTYLEAPG